MEFKSSQETLTKVYIPALKKATGTVGEKLLSLAHVSMEGFKLGTAAYRNNNPGNLDYPNRLADSKAGRFCYFNTLEKGINAQIDYLRRVATGAHKAYAKKAGNNTLKEYIYIYAPPSENKPENYISKIIDVFKIHGITINRNTTINQILQLDEKKNFSPLVQTSLWFTPWFTGFMYNWFGIKL